MSASHPTTHSKFSAADADILILSSDNVLFRLHSVNIRTHTTVFPIGDNLTASDDPATFSETSSILEILFAHLYPYPPLPDLQDLEMEVVQAVGCAAHKYGIASAMLVADLKMIAWAEEYPNEVASYALLHFEAGPRLDRAMVHSINIPLEQAITLFTPRTFVAWLIHRERWCSKVYGASAQFGTAQSYAINAHAGQIVNVQRVSYSECVRDVAAMNIALLPPDAS